MRRQRERDREMRSGEGGGGGVRGVCELKKVKEIVECRMGYINMLEH